MSEVIENLLAGVIAVVFVGGLIWWNVYKYDECKNVGHSTTYCMFARY